MPTPQHSIESSAVADILGRITRAPYGEDVAFNLYFQIDTDGLDKPALRFLEDIALHCGGTTGVTQSANKMLVHFDAGLFHADWSRSRLVNSFSVHAHEISSVNDAVRVRMANIDTSADTRVFVGVGRPGLYAKAVNSFQRESGLFAWVSGALRAIKVAMIDGERKAERLGD